MKKVYPPLPRIASGVAGALLLGSTLALLSTGTAHAAAADGAQNDSMLQGDWGQIKLNLRYRFEHVEQENIGTANGDPLRLRLGYLTPNFAGFQAYGEFEGNTPVFASDYNDKFNGKTDYAVIADPSEGELNQAWLSYNTIPDTVLKGGRQRIILDNQRFVGAVGWRQMEQTFDSVNLFNASLGALDVNATYVWNVRTIVSSDANMNSPLLNVKYTFQGLGSLSGYGYWLDYDDPDSSGGSPFAYATQTYGLRFTGTTAVADNLKLLYTAEYASQSDYQKNPTDYSADYYHFIGGLSAPNSGSLVSNITGKLGYEVLGSDSGVSFKTPLGTNHAFNGFADLFLTAPAEGLQDLYGVVSSDIAGVNLALMYHDFQADTGGGDYGTEVDVKLTKKFGKHYSVLAMYADYSADEYKVDTKKFWLQFVVSY